MCKKEEKCELRNDLKGCTLKHIGEARKLISNGKVEDADAELSYAEKHLKENKCTCSSDQAQIFPKLVLREGVANVWERMQRLRCERVR